MLEMARFVREVVRDGGGVGGSCVALLAGCRRWLCICELPVSGECRLPEMA